MDAADLAILRELTRDARLPVTELAARVHLSRAHTYRRIEAMRSQGVLLGFSADIDPVAAGLPVSALMLLETHQARWQDLHEPLRGMPQVQYAAATSGDTDVAVLVRAGSVNELRDVVLARVTVLEAVQRVKTLVVLDELVRPRPVLPS